MVIEIDKDFKWHDEPKKKTPPKKKSPPKKKTPKFEYAPKKGIYRGKPIGGKKTEHWA